jgi:peptidyl-prolyl cis-trans isomerase SurA
MKQILLLLTASVAATCSVSAQQQRILADKIAAKVGDKIILHSDIVNALADYKRAGQEMPENAECIFFEGQLIQKALELQAEKDSLSVSEEELDGMIENKVRALLAQYSVADIETITGKTLYQFKEDMRPLLKERKLAEQMRGKIVDNVKVTPTEVTAYFNKIPKDSLPFYESELQLTQIVLYPKASRDVEEYVISELKGYKQQIESGRQKIDFFVKNSDDPGSKENGGQYTLNRTEKNFDPAFMAAAFKLKDGQVSEPFKSKFGWHIIQMVSRSGDEAIVKHILRIPPVDQAQINLGLQKLDSIRNLINKGMPFNIAVSQFTEDEYAKQTGGVVVGPDGSTAVTIDQLDKDLVANLKNMKVGEVSNPQPFTDARGTKGVRLVFYKSMTEPHRGNLKDDYNKFAARALEDKKQQILEQWFKEHIATFYITLDKDFVHCQNITEWIDAANKNTTAAN